MLVQSTLLPDPENKGTFSHLCMGYGPQVAAVQLWIPLVAAGSRLM